MTTIDVDEREIDCRWIEESLSFSTQRPAKKKLNQKSELFFYILNFKMPIQVLYTGCTFI